MSLFLRRSAAMSPAPAVILFQRGSQVELRRRRRRISLRPWHIVLLVLVQAALFTGLQRLCFFLLDWDHLRLTRVEVYPRSEPGSARVEKEASRYLSTNLLVLDTARLAAEIKSFSWIKDARIRKAFPSTLRVDITVRKPLAVLDRGTLFLVDEEGVLLRPADTAAAAALPVLRDATGFAEDYGAKIRLARECLGSLSAGLRARVEELDLSAPDCLSLTFRNDGVRLILGRDGFGAKLELYDRQAARWAADFGRLVAVDFRIPDRAYLRLRAGGNETAATAARGEVM